MTEPKWISTKALLWLHEESLAEFGGGRGVRDEGLLESALARPLQVHCYEPEATLSRLAAAYCFGLVKNHALVDGNKRLGFLALGLVLTVNGYELVADQTECINVILAVACGEMDEASLVRWVVDRMIALD